MATRARGSVARSLPLIVLLLLAPGAADAQIGGLGKKIKEKAKQRVEQVSDREVDKQLDRVQCAITDETCIADAQAAGKAVEVTGGEAGAGAGAAKMSPGQGAWANFDFIPGERVLYADDFTGDDIGDFPRRMEFQSGALEIVEWQGSRWLRATEDSKFYVVLPEPLPDRFTMEFDYAIPSGEVWVYFGDDQQKRLTFGGLGVTAVQNFTTHIDAQGRYGDNDPERLRHASVLVDGRYVKVYLDDKRILNVPNADMERSNKILFYTDAVADKPSLFGNFRVAAGGRKLYDALSAEGRVATQGIYFDTGSDRLRPESTPTLKEIGTMLQEHPDLALTIEGHTDSVGNDAANQALSQRRADSVKAHLVAQFGVDAARLEAVGLGETKPVASNDTPDGRQQNRRVELVRK